MEQLITVGGASPALEIDQQVIGLEPVVAAKAFLYCGDEVLLLQRADRPDRAPRSRPCGTDIPGGELHPGEAPAAGVLREIGEELGQELAQSVNPDSLRITFGVTVTKPETGVSITKIYYVGAVACREFVLGEEHEGGLWVPRTACLQAIDYPPLRQAFAISDRVHAWGDTAA